MPRGRKKKSKELDTAFAEPTRKGVKVRFVPRTVNQAIDKMMGANRPAVLAHLRLVAGRHPELTSAELITLLEKRYLATVMASGAATGAVAVIPAVGTITSLGLSAFETVAFLEATALFAQSVAEVHGLTVDDPDRARALVLALLLGKEGSAIIRQWGVEALYKDATRSDYWGELVAAQASGPVIGTLVKRLRDRFVRHFATREGANIVARAMPYGIGVVLGGFGNRVLGRRVISSAREAFGPVAREFAPIATVAADPAKESAAT